MTDTARPSSGDSGNPSGEGPRRRGRRRRGSRPAGKAQPAASGEHPPRGRRRAGANTGSDTAAAGTDKTTGKATEKATEKATDKGANKTAGKKSSDRPRGRKGRGRASSRQSQKQNQKPGQKQKQGSKQKHRQGPKNSQRHGRPSQRGARHARYVDSAMEARDETSAGGLVVSGMAEAVAPNGDVDLSRIYVALIGRLDRRGRLLWSMPKGHVEPGEHQWKTAEREVWEETGITGEAFETLGVIDYWFVSDGVRIHKTVHHNLLRFVDGILNDEDPEVTEVTWVPMSELIEHLAYADERKLARIAYDRMPELARKEADAGRATPR